MAGCHIVCAHSVGCYRALWEKYNAGWDQVFLCKKKEEAANQSMPSIPPIAYWLHAEIMYIYVFQC